MKRISVLLLVVLLLGITVSVSAAGSKEGQAQGPKYPTRPVELLIPMSAGGSHDLVARAIVAVIPKYLGQTMTVTLRPGASGVIGTTEAANAPKDGYKLLLGGTGPNSAVPLAQDVPYTADSFIPIAMINYTPNIVIVPGDSPFNSIKDLIAGIKANPGKLNFATSGVYSNSHVPQSMLWFAADVLEDITPVHYDGGGPQVVAILASQCDVSAPFPSQVVEHVKSGKIKALAITDTQRIPATDADGVFKDVPTVQEQGYDVVFRMWKTVLAPAGTPKEIVDYLRDVFAKLSKDEEFRGLLKQIGERDDLYMDGPDFKKLWEKEIADIAPVMKRMKEAGL